MYIYIFFIKDPQQYESYVECTINNYQLQAIKMKNVYNIILNTLRVFVGLL